MKVSYSKASYNPLRGQRGQLVIEYVLLIVLVVAMAVGITRTLVARGPDREDTGFLIRNWIDLTLDIGADRPDVPR